MTRDEIIRLARHADREWDCDRAMLEWVLRFAEMVAKAEREQIALMNPAPVKSEIDDFRITQLERDLRHCRTIISYLESQLGLKDSHHGASI